MTPMTKTSSASRNDERTQAQESNFRRLLRDIAEHATTVALSKIKANRKGWQRAIEQGNKLREAVTDAVISVVGEISTSRLRFVNTSDVPATEDLVLTEQLLQDKFNIRWLGDNFRSLFVGKTLEGAGSGKLAIHSLAESSTNQQLKDELGDGAISPLAYLLSLVENQKQGGAGPLLTNGCANLLIVEVEGSVWVVDVRWHSGCGYWRAGADPLEGPCEWRAGGQVVSCDS
jgi:hypothetical protein